MQYIERIVEVLQIQRQEVVKHVTAPQIQEAIRQVTVFPRWCLRLMSDHTECVFIDSDEIRLEPIDDVAGNCVPQTNQPDARQQVNNQGLFTGAEIQSPADPRCQTSWSVWSGRTAMSMTSGRTNAAC